MGEPQVYHLSQRRFPPECTATAAAVVKQLTRELAAQEVAVWKKVSPVIAPRAQQLLAPITSLAHSGRWARQPIPAQSEQSFTTIGERAGHLASFIRLG